MEIEKIVSRIRSGKQGREEIIRFLFLDQKLRNGVSRVVKNILGNHDDLNYVFKVSVVQLIKNVLKNEDFEIQTNLYTYFYEVARYLCLVKMRDRNKTFSTVYEELALVKEDINIDLQIINDNRKDHLHELAKTIDPKGKEVLALWASGTGFKEMAKIVGFASDDVARKKKQASLKTLSVFLNESSKN